ncbi:SPFH domain-containing protein [Streptomyces sp. NPDC005752]|uniref:SPFH domain-containing protein n=1 Tax=Streptomyces sp. NPDC005752 TaxID=3157065 RepID=UPI0033E424DE
MRSTENVRGEWDELGERDTRVILPGPGAGDGRGQASGEVPPVTQTYDAGVPGPGAESAGAMSTATELEPASVLSATAAPWAPWAPSAPLVGQPAVAPVEPPAVMRAAPPAGEDETVPADPGQPPAAVTAADRAVPAPGGGPADLDLDLDLDPAPDTGGAPGVRPGPDTGVGLGVRPAPDAVVGLDPAPRPETPAPCPDRGPDVHRGPDPMPVSTSEPVVLDPLPVIGTEPPSLDPASGLWSPRDAATDAYTPVSARADTEVADGADTEAAACAGTMPFAPAEADARPAPVDRRGARGSEPAGGQPEFRPGGAQAPDGEDRAPATPDAETADPDAVWGAGRRRPVISTETTAPIPVHLLFRDDGQGRGPAGADITAAGAAGTVAGAVAAPAAGRTGVRRPPPPRSPRAQAPRRPAPPADMRLTERPGPVLPGWVALFTAAVGTAAGVAVLWWQGALPATVYARLGLVARPYDGIGVVAWALLGLTAAVLLLALCGLGRGRAGYASVLTLFGGYRGSVHRTGLLWVSPLLRRRRVDVRLRHWRSEPLRAVDASGTALRAVVLVVWRVKDTVRAALGVADHERYLRDQVEAALARVLSQLPADAFHEDTHTLRDAEAVGDALTRMVKADCEPVGIEVYSAQPTGIEYAPEVAAAMQRCRVAAIDAKHRDGVLTSLVDAVDDTVGRLTARGIVELDAYEHKALVRDLTVAFYTGRSGSEGS